MRPIIIALDFEDRNQVFNFLDRFDHQDQLFVKVGMELFYFEDRRFYWNYVSVGFKFSLI